MKTVAFLLPAMRMGGAEKIFLNFVKEIPADYRVTVILNKIEGELLDRLPTAVTVQEDRLWSFHEILSYDLKHLSIGWIIKDVLYYLRVKFGKNRERNYRYIVSRSPYVGDHFDCAVSYVANVSTQIFSLVDRIPADKKIAWMHGETNELHDIALFTDCFQQCDKIFCVSEVTRAHFAEKFPLCADKTAVYYNPIDAQAVLEGAKLEPVGIPIATEGFKLVTVGRLSREKGCDMIPQIAKRLLPACPDLKWYIVGNGPMYDELQSTIAALCLQETVFMVGNQNNPYPYMARCDVYVQPSYEEGYSTTICEAGILGKPIIGTVTSGGIREQITEDVSALLAQPTPESLASAIERLYTDAGLRANLAQAVLNEDMVHSSEIYKLTAILKET